MDLLTSSPYFQYYQLNKSPTLNNYDEIAPVFDEVMGEDFLSAIAPSTLSLLKKKFGEQASIRHLDIACGTGLFLILVAENFNTKSFGIDLSESQIAEAKKNLQGHSKRIEFSVGDMCGINFPEQCDLVTINFDSLNHIHSLDDWQIIFKRVKKCLKKDGLFLFDINSPKRLEKDWFHPEIIIKPDLTYVQCGLEGHRDKDVYSRSILVQIFQKKKINFKLRSALIKQTTATKNVIIDMLKRAGFNKIGLRYLPFNDRNQHIFLKNRYFFKAEV